MMNLHITNGRVIDPASGTDKKLDLFMSDGQIVALQEEKSLLDFEADEVIDAEGLTIVPGLVDLSVALTRKGYDAKTVLHHELQAALRGGVTALVCPPDMHAIMDKVDDVYSLQTLQVLGDLQEGEVSPQIFPLGALTQSLQGKQLTEMKALYEAGCIAFSQADTPIVDTNVLLRAMQYASGLGLRLWLRPQDAFLGQGGVVNSGALASRMGLSGVPAMSETLAIHLYFELVRTTKCALHLVGLSTAQGIEMVRAAKQEGLPVTCDVGVYHLHLTEQDVLEFDSNAHIQPPLRTQRDKEAIRQGLWDGTIDAIASRHIPVMLDEKSLPFAESAAGASAVELLLPLVVKWVHESQGKVSLLQALGKITHEAASILNPSGTHSLGKIAVGELANLCIFDMDEHWRVSADNLISLSKSTPYLGYEIPAQVKYTFVHGELA